MELEVRHGLNHKRSGGAKPMAAIPPTDPNVNPTDPSSESQASFQAYRPTSDRASMKRPHKPLLIMAAFVVLLVVGGLIHAMSKPDAAEARDAAPDYSEMTVDQLAEDAGMPAARELTRRMFDGTGAERADASRVFNNPPSMRLRRNLAMSMALLQQQKAMAHNVRMQRHQRMAEEGYGDW